MLIRTDPFRGVGASGAMPMDAWRDDEQIVVKLTCRRWDPGAVDLDVDRVALTVRAEHRPADWE